MTAITSLGEDTEVTEKARRRSFTVEYKRRIVKETNACKAPGEIGALLRREGLYSSQLATWRAARDRGDLAPGAATKKRGPKALAVDPRDKKIAELERQNAKLTTRAERAEAIADIQKNERVRRSRPPVGPETPEVGSMASREEWPSAFW
jgi:transposase-like protein